VSQTEALEAQNTRLRELYENVVGNRERFGWTIDHLLECEEALRTVEARVEALEAQRDEALELARAIAAANDSSLLDEEDECDEPFRRGWLRTERDFTDEYHAVLTPAGRDEARRILSGE
jgi:hypothetical protein